MPPRALASRPADAVCALCAFRLCGRLPGAAPRVHSFRRTIKTTATSRKPIESAVQRDREESASAGGWGVSNSTRDSAWGTAKSPPKSSETPASGANIGRAAGSEAASSSQSRDASGAGGGSSSRSGSQGVTVKYQWAGFNDQHTTEIKPRPNYVRKPFEKGVKSPFHDKISRPSPEQPELRQASDGNGRQLDLPQAQGGNGRQLGSTQAQGGGGNNESRDKEKIKSGRDTSTVFWKHLQFKQPASGSSNAAESTEARRFVQEREERIQNAKRGETVMWRAPQVSEWDREHQLEPQVYEGLREEPQQAQGRDANRRGGRNRRAPRFQSNGDTEADAQANEQETDHWRGRNERASRFQRNNNADRDAQATEQDRKRDKKSKNKNSRGRDDEDEEVDERVMDRIERRRERKAAQKARRDIMGEPTPIILPDFISIGNLAAALRVRTEDFAEKLQEMGFEDFTNDHVIGAEDAGLIAQEYNFEPTNHVEESVFEDLVAAPEPTAEEKEYLLTRPPVITIMGHVDHGKTTLLDYLRQSSVAAGEHGGITQHIGAFSVNMSTGRTITFLDTPGHAAFLDMRARGANVTDIVILVVAADDSVKPQTLEAIKHAQAAEVPMIVAITKVDKEGADIERVKRDLAKHGVQVEDFGGDVQAIPVSGKTGEGMVELEEAAVALADILDVRADTNGAAEGWVLESSMKRVGKVATILVRRGTMRAGDFIVAGKTWAKIRNLRNEAGTVVDEAGPGQPVEVDGWDESPEAGAEVLQAPNLQRAKDVAEHRQEEAEAAKIAEDVEAANAQRLEMRQQQALAKESARLESLRLTDPKRAEELEQAMELARANEADSNRFIQVPIVIRADVAGSVEALSAAVLAIGNNEIRPLVLRADVGAVSESDIELAAAARGAVVGFGSGIVEPSMRSMAESEKVPVLDGNVIYRVTDAVRELLIARLPKKYNAKVLAEADVAMVFDYSIKGRGKVPVAGCKVMTGTVEKSKRFKVLRGSETVYDGTLSALKHHKKDVTEIRKGSDCGMSFQDFTDFQVGDKVQCYELVEEARTL